MKKTLLLLTVNCLLLTGVSHAYRDVPDHSTLRPAINHLIEKGVIDGRGFFRAEEDMPQSWFWEILSRDSGFAPVTENAESLAPIRRLDAIKFAIESKGITAPERVSDKFRSLTKGVPPTARYLHEVEAAFASGLLGAADIQPLRPYDNLKRKDLIRWLYNWEQNGSKQQSNLVKLPPRRSANRIGTEFPYQERLKLEGENADKVRVTVSPVERIPQSRNQDVQVLEEVLRQIDEIYRFEEELTPENRSDWINHGIEAMVEQLEDKHTRYVRPEDSQDFLDKLNGEFEGIGAYVEMIEERFTIQSPIKGSPAEEAGLRPGDTVLEVDGEDIAGQTINEIIAKVKGPAGTEVTLKIERAGRGTFDVTVTRGKIDIPDVTVEFEQGIPILGIHQFNRDTGNRVETALVEEILPKKPRGIIFDLRNNPGGFLTAAVDVGETFLTAGKDIFTVDFKGEEEDRVYRTTEDGLLSDMDNLVFLQNGGSASASEIVTGMIQDHERGTIIGQNSVGKGTVQSILQFSNGGSLKVTAAKWLTPDGRWINETGVVPDIEVTDPTDEENLNEVDRQLDTAIQKVLGR